MDSIKEKVRLGLFFGGKSFEHAISIRSASSIFAAISSARYDIRCIYLDEEGTWLHVRSPEHLEGERVSIEQATHLLDVVFPAFHGPQGEDGPIQGLLELLEIPYVGSGVLGSSLCYDKVMTKRILQANGVPLVRYLDFWHSSFPSYDEVCSKLGPTLFVKPSNSGSSVGVSKVNSAESYELAIAEAGQFDTHILVEEAIVGREIEIAVIGNETLEISPPGEIHCTASFYDYDAKYIDPNAAYFTLPCQVEALLEPLAARAYLACGCRDFARVDFLVDQEGKPYLNEINTIPGFTTISLFPKLMELLGYTYSSLIDRLITLALERSQKRPLHNMNKWMANKVAKTQV